MKYIYLIFFVMSMRGGMADTSSNLAEELPELKEMTRVLMTKNAEQNVKIAKQNQLIMEQNVKIANQDRLIMEHRMSSAVQGNSVLQTQNNLLERALSSMQQWYDQQQELLSKISKLEILNETVMEYVTHQQQDLLSSMQQRDDRNQELFFHQRASLESLNETVIEIAKGQGHQVVGFAASLGSHFTAGENEQRVIFETVQTNIGQHYDNTNGIFTAPLDGMYIFQWTVLTTHGKIGDTYLVVNGQRKRLNNCNSRGYGSFGHRNGSASVVLSLKRNDRVWIATWKNHFMWGVHWTSFQGWLQNSM